MLARVNVAILRKHRRKKKTPVSPRTRFKGKLHISTKKLRWMTDEDRGNTHIERDRLWNQTFYCDWLVRCLNGKCIDRVA